MQDVYPIFSIPRETEGYRLGLVRLSVSPRGWVFCGVDGENTNGENIIIIIIIIIVILCLYGAIIYMNIFSDTLHN